jgi:hypothetical protein
MANGPPMALNQAGFYVDFVYFLALFLLALSIYFQTRKIQSFSFHKGIHYFRNAFLYFALIYLFRFVTLNLQMTDSLTPDIQTAFVSLSQFLVIFFSMIAIFSLAASFSWKKYPFISEARINLASVFLAGLAFFARLPAILLLVVTIAVVFLLLKAYDNYNRKTVILSPLFVIYLLLLVFICFDLLPQTQELFSFEFKLAGYVGSLCIFVFLNLKVKKVLAAGKDEAK